MEERILTAVNKARSAFYDKLCKELGTDFVPMGGPTHSAFVDSTNELGQETAKAKKRYSLSFKKFVESRRFELADKGSSAELYGECRGESVPAFLYDNGLSVSIRPNGQFWVILCNEEHTSFNIADVEAELYHYYLSNF